MIFKRTDYAILISATLMISFCFLISPMMVRTLMDGIMTTEDMFAVTVAIISIAFCEIASINMSGVLRFQVDKMQSKFISHYQQVFLERWTKGEIHPDRKEIDRFWFSDLNRVANFKIRQRWARVRDIMLIVILGVVAVSINAFAGIFLISFMGIQILTGVYFNNKWGLAAAISRSVHEKEEDIVERVTHSVGLWRDEGVIDHQSQVVKEDLKYLNRKKFKIDRFRSLTDDTFRAYRTIAILGILCFAFHSVGGGNTTVGSIWALVMVAYRLLGPAESLSKWVLEERRAKHSLERFHRWISLKSVSEARHPEQYGSIKKILQSVAESRSNTFIIANRLQRDFFIESARLWRDRVEKRLDVFIFTNDFSLQKLNVVDVNRPTLIVLNNIGHSIQNRSQNREEFKAAVLEYKNITWVVLDSVAWFDRSWSCLGYYFDDKMSDFLPVPGAFAKDIEKRNFEMIVLNNWCEHSREFGDLYRDILRFHRMNVPATVGYIENLPRHKATFLQQSMRKFDHLVPVPGGGYIICFSNCAKENVSRVTNRLGGDAYFFNTDARWSDLRSNSDESKRNLNQLETFLADSCLGSIISVSVDHHSESEMVS